MAASSRSPIRWRSAFAGHTQQRPAVPPLPALPPAEPLLALLPDDRPAGDGAARRRRRGGRASGCCGARSPGGRRSFCPGSPRRHSSSSSIRSRASSTCSPCAPPRRGARRPNAGSLAAVADAPPGGDVTRAARGWLMTAAAAGVAISIAIPTWHADDRRQPSETFLAGSGGVPGGRELGRWIRTNVPKGAEFLAIGPSMANIVEFYGQRRAWGLSVGPNPLHRNPSYDAAAEPGPRDPDERGAVPRLGRLLGVADRRSSSNKLLAYAHRYHGASSTRNRCPSVRARRASGASR